MVCGREEECEGRNYIMFCGLSLVLQHVFHLRHSRVLLELAKDLQKCLVNRNLFFIFIFFHEVCTWRYVGLRKLERNFIVVADLRLGNLNCSNIIDQKNAVRKVVYSDMVVPDIIMPLLQIQEKYCYSLGKGSENAFVFPS